MTKAERDQLLDFLKKTVEILDKIASADWLLFNEEAREEVVEAWREARERYKSKIKGIESSLNSGNYDTSLEDAGLTGKQLKAKMGIFKRLWRRFTVRGGLKALKKLLDWINRILDSLSSAIPGVEFIKEAKDLMEAVIDDTLDPSGHWV